MLKPDPNIIKSHRLFNVLFFIHTTISNGTNDESNMSIEEKASLLAAKYSSKYDKSKPTDGSGSKLKREDSTDDLMKSIALAKERRQKRLEELMKVNHNAKNQKM